MSIVWFIILFYAYGNGIEITDMEFMMCSIFYIGDCILIRKWNRRANDGKIDTDKLKADLEKAISKNEDMDCLDFLRVASFIDAQPTAYDPDKVVRQLEDYGNEETHYYKNTPYEKCIEECIGKAIQIVKGGGVDAKTDS